jgi:hypothetical protein
LDTRVDASENPWSPREIGGIIVAMHNFSRLALAGRRAKVKLEPSQSVSIL